MIKLNELPPEIIDMVVQAESEPQYSAEDRYEDLRSFARISRIFQYSSQKIMHERVVLKSKRTMRLWLKKRRKEVTVQELKLDLPDDYDETMAGEDLVIRVIQACSPLLRKFSIIAFRRFDSYLLMEDNLKEITSLLISADIELAEVPHFSFPRLQDLSMADESILRSGRDYNDGLLEAVLSRVGPALTALTLDQLEDGEHTFSEIDLVAHQLKSLVFSDLNGTLSALPKEILHHCDRLEFLQLDIDDLSLLLQILQHLPTSSHSLVELRCKIREAESGAASLIEQQAIDSILSLPQLRELESLTLESIGLESRRAQRAKDLESSAWFAKWAKKGVEIKYDRWWSEMFSG